MPSDSDVTDLARSIADLKDEFRSGLSTLKQELSEEHNTALNKLKTASASAQKFQKKGTRSSFLSTPKSFDTCNRPLLFFKRLRCKLIEKALEELKEGETKLSNRNKLILIADSSDQASWE
ncbi:hypothetical protein OS493_028122 [Desmophyllum pertusum]|uniref:Uncharacterized protein n=1 Tax=Desmophyllum pertusum TaxID=174260 RepID=A0A9W9ZKK6_9CNID|nr:hypothetical protein OS493_028122 [Desmophyllum pertusum]